MSSEYLLLEKTHVRIQKRAHQFAHPRLLIVSWNGRICQLIYPAQEKSANVCQAICTCYGINRAKLNANFDSKRKITDLTVILCGVIKNMCAKNRIKFTFLVVQPRFGDFYLPWRTLCINIVSPCVIISILNINIKHKVIIAEDLFGQSVFLISGRVSREGRRGTWDGVFHHCPFDYCCRSNASQIICEELVNAQSRGFSPGTPISFRTDQTVAC